jgi:hypothetical protein
LKQILSLPQNTPDYAVYIFTDIISIEKQIEKKTLIFFNNIWVCFFSKKNILIPKVAEKNILILVEEKKII